MRGSGEIGSTRPDTAGRSRSEEGDCNRCLEFCAHNETSLPIIRAEQSDFRKRMLGLQVIERRQAVSNPHCDDFEQR